MAFGPWNPAADEGERFRRADRTALLVVNLFAVKTQAGGTKLHLTMITVSAPFRLPRTPTAISLDLEGALDHLEEGPLLSQNESLALRELEVLARLRMRSQPRAIRLVRAQAVERNHS